MMLLAVFAINKLIAKITIIIICFFKKVVCITHYFIFVLILLAVAQG